MPSILLWTNIPFALNRILQSRNSSTLRLAAAHAGIPVTEYASKTVKRAVVGTGGAEKEQVAMMVRTLLPGAGPVKGDAADALAVAICDAHHRTSLARQLETAGTARPALPIATRIGRARG
jgi:crossover junction endodeoxyribonuclease RuvC